MIVGAFADTDVIAHTRSTLDITDARAVMDAVAAIRPGLIVNCAAYNDVDGAESEPLAALAVNAFAVRSLARAAMGSGATLVHYSTDFVFDGTASEPYTEDAVPAPRSTYAASKLLGEWFALEVPRSYVLRVESLFGAPRGWKGRRGTLDGLVTAMEEGREVRVFTDRVVSPTYTVDIAAATRHLTEVGAAPGVYHCVNSGQGSWADIVGEVAAMLRLTPRLVPVTMDQVPMRAKRPRYCALNPARLAAAGFPMPPWSDAVRRWLADRTAPAA
jgi:dTDP-4-dehydrorhamnose reductase